MTGFIPKTLYKGCHHLSSELVVSCSVAETYYKIGGTWTNGQGKCAFVYDGSGKITYNERKSMFLFTGVDGLAGDVSVLSLDIHYQTNSNGSDLEYSNIRK